MSSLRLSRLFNLHQQTKNKHFSQHFDLNVRYRTLRTETSKLQCMLTLRVDTHESESYCFAKKEAKNNQIDVLLHYVHTVEAAY
jgi:hypothetical protein